MERLLLVQAERFLFFHLLFSEADYDENVRCGLIPLHPR